MNICPLHQTQMSGGPILYTCDVGIGHTVRAADIDREYHPRAVTR